MAHEGFQLASLRFQNRRSTDRLPPSAPATDSWWAGLTVAVMAFLVWIALAAAIIFFS